MTMTMTRVPAEVVIPGWTITDTETALVPGTTKVRYVRTTCDRDEVSIFHFGDYVNFHFWWTNGNRASGEATTLARTEAFAKAIGPRAKVLTLKENGERWAGRTVRVML